MSDFDGMQFSFGDEGTGAGETDEAVSSDSLANPFLSNIPEADREIVGRYVKDWDAGVTRKFQEIHSKYQPYKELGEIEEIRTAMQLRELMDNDPQTFYKALSDWMKEMGQEEEVITPGSTPPVGDLDDTTRQVIEFQNAQLQKLQQQIEEQNARLEHEKQLAALDKLMKDLHTEHGEFDDEAVLLRISKGMKPQDAIKDYNSWVEKLVSSQKEKRPPAPVIGSGSGVPLGQVDRKTLATDSSARKALIVEMLKASNG